MSNYDFSLDMKTDNSNSLLLRNIKPNSTVLEMGPAHGRMTKYLKEQLNCIVTIVEKDEVAGACAAQYAFDALIGEEQGDLEKPWWITELAGKKFDYIIFADVLEHLYIPERVLAEAKHLLYDMGSVFMSIPNIAHNAVLIDLLQNKFEYRDSGLLDKTHIKFFTHASLKNFVATAGLTTVQEMNAINTVSNSEFNNSYYQLPKAIGDYLMERPYGEVYQFIWELKRSTIQTSIIIPVMNKINFTISALKDLSYLDRATVEIIVIDNGSSDETQLKLLEIQKSMHNLIYIRNEINMGFGGAVNKAFNVSKGNKIIILNNDIRVKSNHSNWTEQLLQQADENILVGPTGGFVDPKLNYEFQYETSDVNKYINYLSGWCIAATRKTFENLILDGEIGPFDSKTFFVFYEDTDLSFRAQIVNIALKIVPVDVVHFGHITAKTLNINKLYNESKHRFLQKWKIKNN